MADRDRVREALELLLEQAREKIDRHPFGHLLPHAGGRLDLRLNLPLGLPEQSLDAAAGGLAEALDRGVQDLLAQAAIFQPGRVFCLRCQRADCEHATPRDSREVFAGFGPTGAPRFVDFGQLLLDRRDPRVEALYDEEAAHLLTSVLTEEELTAELLPAFRDPQRDYRIHGHVAAGWWRIPDEAGARQHLAVSVLVTSARPRGGRRRFGLNVVSRGPGGESLEHLHERVGAIPWTPAVRWGQSILNRIGAAEARKPSADEVLARRIGGLLGGVARRLARVQRARDRRTHHAEERHNSGERPTRMAILDLSRAEDGDILVDERRATIVVLGDRGRAHMFNKDGKLVTSVRYPPQTIARRRETGAWRPATPEETAEIRSRAVLSDL